MLVLVALFPFGASATQAESIPEVLGSAESETSTQAPFVPEQPTTTDEPPPIVEVLPPESIPEATDQTQLQNIQVLLMYICGIAIFWTVVDGGKLMYRFFNMFF